VISAPTQVGTVNLFRAVSRLLVGVAMGGSILTGAAGQTNARPNIIVILADDQGYADLGVQGQVKDIRTPNIDALAAAGVRCMTAFATSPQCSPSRAGLITGRYQNKFGLDNIPDDPMPLTEVTIPERLKKAGYVSGMVGKWHLDPNALSLKWARTHLPDAKPNAQGRINVPLKYIRPYSALAQGFDECYQGEMRHYFATYDLDGQTLDPKGKELNNPDFRLDVQTDAALAFLKRHHGQDGQPFFLYLAYFGPHVPLEAPTNYLARFPGPMPERRRYALAMISAMDDGVGRITAALKQYGISTNTLIFYTSDNGAPLGAAQPDGPMTDVLPVGKIGPFWDGSRNDPWVGEKGMLADGGTHVPFLVSWPGQLPAGEVYEAPVSTLDIASTAVALAGLPHDDRLDGVNLMPFLTRAATGTPNPALYWRFWDQTAVRAGKWKYVQAGNAAKYLFDMSTPANERTNLLGQYPEIARDLAAKLSDWTQELSPPGGQNHPLNPPEKKWYEYYFGLRND
jgi:arylsulfatase A-like enzyme